MTRNDYEAPGWLRNPHAQTVYGSLFARAPAVAYRRERWDTPDGDFVDIDHVDGPAESPLLVLFHGLEGSSRSPYARMLMQHVANAGWRGAVFNFRGCSGEPNRLARAYHSGDAAEIGWALRRFSERAARAPLLAAGVSLGGNALLKWLGEQGANAQSILSRAAAISAPVDLMAAGEALEHGFCKVYARHFLSTMKARAADKHRRFPGSFDVERMTQARTLREFDDVYTAPIHGYLGTDDYWTRASAKPGLRNVAVPTLLLNAKDDPFLPAHALPTVSEVSSAVTVDFPEQGGHVGFVSGAFPGHVGWLPARVLRFFAPREQQ